MSRLLAVFLALVTLVSCVEGGNGNVSKTGKVRVPWGFNAEGYPAHVHLTWAENVGSTYDIYRADKPGKFTRCAQVSGNEYMDFTIGKSDKS